MEKKTVSSQAQSLEKAPGETWSPALEKFAQSMTIGFDQWHDGIGYDLDALLELKGDELARAEAVLIARKNHDWRDSEALAALNSTQSAAALKSSISSPNVQVKLRAARQYAAEGDVAQMEDALVESLRTSKIYAGLTQALALAEEHPTERVKQTLFWCALHGNDDVRVHAAALLFYLYGIAESNFDWDFRPFFLRFNTQDLEERRAAFLELCRRVNVDPDGLDLEPSA
ncbi:MAG TPA: hypothetical protein VF600_02695 [Abditibacteriaceae bacterium]